MLMGFPYKTRFFVYYSHLTCHFRTAYKLQKLGFFKNMLKELPCGDLVLAPPLLTPVPILMQHKPLQEVRVSLTALQPYMFAALQPYSLTCLQPYSLRALQPSMFADLQPYNITCLQPCNLTALHSHLVAGAVVGAHGVPAHVLAAPVIRGALVLGSQVRLDSLPPCQ